MSSLWSRNGAKLALLSGAVLAVIIGSAVLAPWLAPFDPAEQLAGPPLAAPSADHWLGTDRYGRDVASRLLYGGRATLLFTGLTMLVIVTIGTVIGSLVALAHPTVDRLAAKVIDTLIAFPTVIAVFALVGFFGPSLTTVFAGAMVVWWAPFARLARSLARTALAEPSSQTSQVLGASRTQLLAREVWPRMRGSIIVLLVMETAQFVSTVAALSFLGFGAQPPAAEWGAMLSDSRSYFSTAPHLLLAPALAVFVTVLAMTGLGEGLGELLDRASKKVSA